MWDAFQREVLTALGHTLFVPASATPVGITPAGSMQVGSTPAPPMAATNATQPALLRALARAAGTAGVEGLGDLPPLDQLRNATAKRALWPRLRAMRSRARS